MDIAKCLALIDLLCAREFPARHGRTEHGESGPGYHIAALGTSGGFEEGDGAEREETEAQYEADRDGLGERLTQRWGPPQEFSLYSVLERSLDGAEAARPWSVLSGHVPDVQLWQPSESERWVALGISRWDKELPCRLLAVVTDVDPP
ncbi:hypothetical protein [Streptomyces sp. NPDC086787]|uniref:hypothetical protein n=1 Tax=Streptomyces sp. NPDC086787 TaxID=3365759 RepID=UPI0038126E6A